MRLTNSTHTSREWRIHELAHDFRLEDVWALPTPGGPDGAELGARVPTLRDRLPEDLRDAPSGPDFDALPFTPLYLLEDEFAAEVINRTVHGILHLGWVPDGTGGYRGEMAVYVKPNGLLGVAYMAAIKPFRHLIVYPALMRQLGREWRAGIDSAAWRGATA